VLHTRDRQCIANREKRKMVINVKNSKWSDAGKEERKVKMVRWREISLI